SKDLEALKLEARRVKKTLRAAGSIASSAALMATTATFFLRRRPEPVKRDNHDHAKASWVNAALTGARVGASLFYKVRSFLRERGR
ncbi:MAG: hypothetical protein ACREFR_17145, partial [Limisphaerales bacterium]